MPCTIPPHLWLLRILGPFCEEPHTGNFMRLIREYLLVSFPKETYLEYRQSASKRQDEGSSFSRNLAPHSTASRGVCAAWVWAREPLARLSVCCFQEILDAASHNVYNMHITGRVWLEWVVRCDRSSDTLGQYVWSGACNG